MGEKYVITLKLHPITNEIIVKWQEKRKKK